MLLFAMQIRGTCADVYVCALPALPLHRFRLLCVCVCDVTQMYACPCMFAWEAKGILAWVLCKCVGEASRVVSVSGHSRHRRKLVLMGLFPLLRISPLHECAPSSRAKPRLNPLVLQMFLRVREVWVKSLSCCVTKIICESPSWQVCSQQLMWREKQHLYSLSSRCSLFGNLGMASVRCGSCSRVHETVGVRCVVVITAAHKQHQGVLHFS